MKNLVITRFCSVSFIVLAALCGGSSNAAVLPTMQDVSDIESMYSSLDRSASLGGPDMNANGVRDDVEHIIDTIFVDELQRRAAMQTAKSLQAAILVDVNDNNATRAVSEASMYAVHCLFERFPLNQTEYTPDWVSRHLEAMTANTRPRVQAYLNYNAALNGTTSSVPNVGTCE